MSQESDSSFDEGEEFTTDTELQALKAVATKTYGSVKFSVQFCYFHFCHSVLKGRFPC